MTPSSARQPAREVGYPGPAADRTPPWPETLIAPVGREVARWSQLWRLPQAAEWTRGGREHAVATLVRLEQRCHHATRPSARCASELSRLRRDLGLMTLV